jgi:predicted SAM-dependent methyltransferase
MEQGVMEDSILERGPAQADEVPSEIKLHVGGVEPKDGWTIVNIQEGPNVDVLGSATDLSMFEDSSVSMIYASHILEHLSYMHELDQALKEFVRVLKQGGILLASVPDLEILCRLYLLPNLNPNQRYFVMRMIYGGQTDDFDYHKVGFNFWTMCHFLQKAGFDRVTRVESHGLFNDTSEKIILGAPISLNIKAVI